MSEWFDPIGFVDHFLQDIRSTEKFPGKVLSATPASGEKASLTSADTSKRLGN
jgi:hypothetical protein